MKTPEFYVVSVPQDTDDQSIPDLGSVYAVLFGDFCDQLNIERTEEARTAFTNAFRVHSTTHMAFVDETPRLREYVKKHLPSTKHESYQQLFFESKQYLKLVYMSNSIHIISAYIHDGQWVFDDASRELDKEPFVAGADTVIDLMSGRVDDDSIDKCTLIFSHIPFPSHQYKAVHKHSDKYDGNTYTFVVPQTNEPIMDFWLCPALLKFYDEAPSEIYVQCK